MKISVVIPTYNRRELVLQAIDSVKRQTLPAYEIIVIVDGSNDGTGDALRSVHPDVRVLEFENRGLAVSRNRGTASATGDWIAFLDDDDLWHPEKLAKMQEYHRQNPGCEAMICPSWFFTSDKAGPAAHLGLSRDFVAATLADCLSQTQSRSLLDDEAAGRLRQTTADMPSIMRRNQGLYASSITVHRQVLIASGGSCPMFMQGEDWTLLLNVARLTTWHVLGERLVFSRIHNSQMSSGGPTAGLESLCGSVGMWRAGRALRHRLNPHELNAALVSLAHKYRRDVQAFLWATLTKGDLKTAGQIRAAGRLLLPRFRDRLYTLIPPQLTWRFERYILGMHQ